MAEFEANKQDVEGNWMKMIDLSPGLSARLRAGKREAKFVGTPVANYFRKPYGPGWALVGDAGYNRDYITAMGIMDAFLSAELCADALHQSFAGTRPFDEAMGDYQRARDQRVHPIFEFTCQVAALEPPSAQLQQVLGAAHGNQEAMDGFARRPRGRDSVHSPAAQLTSPKRCHVLSIPHLRPRSYLRGRDVVADSRHSQ